jgi:hypothetical protein
MVQVIVLSANGEKRVLKSTAITGVPTGEMIAKALRKKTVAEKIGVWEGEEADVFILWGWRDGKAGTENKHELPPPHDKVLLFGDAIVTFHEDEDGEALNVKLDQWTTFYDTAFEGFEDLGSEDSESEASESDDAESTSEFDDDGDDDGSASGDDTGDEDVEEDASGSEAEEEEEDADDDCYDDEDGGGGKRRAPRRRAVAAPEYRRIDMGLRSRIKMPTPPTKRAPRWQTASELEAEEY